MNSLRSSSIVHSSYLLTNKSRRVCGMEAQIPVGQGMRLGSDLVQRIGAIRAIVERVPLVPLQLIVIVDCRALTDRASAIVFLRSQGRVRIAVRPNIERAMVLVA